MRTGRKKSCHQVTKANGTMKKKVKLAVEHGWSKCLIVVNKMKASAVSEKLKQTRRLELDVTDVSALLNIEDVNHHQH